MERVSMISKFTQIEDGMKKVCSRFSPSVRRCIKSCDYDMVTYSIIKRFGTATKHVFDTMTIDSHSFKVFDHQDDYTYTRPVAEVRFSKGFDSFEVKYISQNKTVIK